MISQLVAGAIAVVIVASITDAAQLVPVLDGEEVDLGQDCEHPILRQTVLEYRGRYQQAMAEIKELKWKLAAATKRSGELEEEVEAIIDVEVAEGGQGLLGRQVQGVGGGGGTVEGAGRSLLPRRVGGGHGHRIRGDGLQGADQGRGGQWPVSATGHLLPTTTTTTPPTSAKKSSLPTSTTTTTITTPSTTDTTTTTITPVVAQPGSRRPPIPRPRLAHLSAAATIVSAASRVPRYFPPSSPSPTVDTEIFL